MKTNPIPEKEQGIILRAIRSQMGQEGVRVSFFGSRVKGSAGRGSDLDVLLDCAKGLDPATKVKIEEILEESNLPYRVDWVDKRQLHASYREEILNNAVECAWQE